MHKIQVERSTHSRRRLAPATCWLRLRGNGVFRDDKNHQSSFECLCISCEWRLVSQLTMYKLLPLRPASPKSPKSSVRFYASGELRRRQPPTNSKTESNKLGPPHSSITLAASWLNIKSFALFYARRIDTNWPCAAASNTPLIISACRAGHSYTPDWPAAAQKLADA